jgi:uncharacterized repeat protein (TIGR03987 family)
MLAIAIISINAALVFYTIGVWSEHRARRLRPWHLAFFLAGLVCDTLGTTLMGEIAGKLDTNLHGLTGALAIGLMLLHAGWAAAALWLNRENVLRSFHRFSLFVWTIWLVPFASGMIMAMLRPI